MKTYILSAIILIVLFFLFLTAFFTLFPAEELSQHIENALLATGLIGIAYSIPLAKKELDNINDKNTPKVVHVGSFDFFNKIDQLKLTTFSSTAFNLYGWVVTNQEMRRLLFVVRKDEAGNRVFGDFFHIWLPKYREGKDEVKEVRVDSNSSKKALHIQDHLVIIYEDGNENKYFSLMTENYRYKFGKLNYRTIAKTINTQAEKITEFEIASRY